VHGYYDHVGVFDKAIAYGLSRGFAVVAFDLPGHGLSSGEPGVITSFDKYGDVLADVLSAFGRCDFLPAHFNALAQSTGCAVVMNYLWRYAQKQNSLPEFDKIALCSPLVLARTWRTTGKIIYALVRHLLRFVPRGGSHSSHDQTFNDFVMNQDTLQSHYLSVQWVGAMKAWHEAIKMYPVLSQSILFIQGTGDMTVDWEYNIPLLQQKSPTASVAYIQNAKHQLLNESAEYRDQVFCLLDQYFS
jgi:lysophospholipase